MERLNQNEHKSGGSLRGLTAYFLKLGTIGFGGPIALAVRMESDLVEKRGWFTREEYLRSLALAQLSPGPLAAQLAMCLGYVQGKVRGATLAALAFISPSFLMVIGLGVLYKRYGELPWVQALFYGIGAAIIGIIAKSAHKLIKLTLKKNLLLWILFGGMAIVTAATGREIVWLFILCGMIAVAATTLKLSSSRTNVLAPFFLLSGTGGSGLFWFFVKAGAFVFGSGLAIVPFLYGGVVEQHHWLTSRQFLDAIAVAMITPGPVVITAGFIGYLVAGIGGALLAALGVFLPPYLVVISITPVFERYAKNERVTAFVEGVTSAATGAIAGAVLVLARQAVVDLPTALILAGTVALLFLRRVEEQYLIAAAGLLGLFLHHPL